MKLNRAYQAFDRRRALKHYRIVVAERVVINLNLYE
jgi:hypothetical protein